MRDSSRQPQVLIRCDGGAEVGFGHVIRCLALADELSREGGCGVAFAMRRDPAGIGLVKSRGYTTRTSREEGCDWSYSQWLLALLGEKRFSVLVLDVRDDMPLQLVASLRKMGILIATIDDPSQRRLLADLAFYPPVPQLNRLDWTGFSGQLLAGWDWVLIRPEFSSTTAVLDVHDPPRILVTMGGSDPMGLTLFAVEALERVERDFDLLVVEGPGFKQHADLTRLLEQGSRSFQIHRNVRQMPGIMNQCDLAVASFGMTAYELAAVGLPALHVCLTLDHQESCRLFVESGLAECLGLWNEVSKPQLARAVSNRLSSLPVRRGDSRFKKLMDGKGTRRVAAKILQTLGRAQS